jgi:hypothetical protein
MVIAGDYERPEAAKSASKSSPKSSAKNSPKNPPKESKQAAAAKPKARAAEHCRLKILSLCF